MSSPFTIVIPSPEGTETTLKWRQGNNGYETVAHTLNLIEANEILPHFFNVRRKIMQVVTTAAHQGQSLFRVYPRTLSLNLQSVWDNVMVDHPPPDNTPASFDATFRHFLAVHSDDGAQNDLVKFLRNVKKPRSMQVYTFYYNLRRLNEYVPWLQGPATVLNDNQLKHLLHDANPQAWQDRLDEKNMNVVNMTLAQTLRWFSTQE